MPQIGDRFTVWAVSTLPAPQSTKSVGALNDTAGFVATCVATQDMRDTCLDPEILPMNGCATQA